MGSRLDSPNTNPPAWLFEFAKPACFDDRSWKAYLLAYYRGVEGGDMKALRAGQPPYHCADCTRSYRIEKEAQGRCFPLRIERKEVAEA